MNANQPQHSNFGIKPIPFNNRLPKRWVLAKRMYGHTRQQLDNETLEICFHHLLYKCKQLLNRTRQRYFERDYRNDNSENAYALHAFISSTLYLYIECSLDYKYRIEYAFNNCPHQAEIKKLLNAYIFDGRLKEVELKPDFNAFYNTVLTVQDKRFLHSL